MAKMAVPTLGTLTPIHAADAYDRRPGNGWWLSAILLLAFSVRVLAAWYWHSTTIESGRLLRLGDSDSYWVLAGHIARGEPYQYGSPDASIFRAPVYPILLSPFTLYSDEGQGIWMARLLGCGLGTFACFLIILWTQRFVGPRAAMISGLIAALYPGAIGMSIVILSEAVFCPLLLLTLMGWHRAMQPQSGWWTACMLAGLSYGLAILARPSCLLLMPLAGTMVLLLHPHRFHQLRVLAVMALACVVVMAPWWIRNYGITGRFVPTTLQVGASLYDGWHTGASGASDENMNFVDDFIKAQRLADQEILRQLPPHESGQATEITQLDLRLHSSFEYRLNARIQAAATAWAAKNVSVVVQLGLIKFGRTWSIWPAAGEVGSTWLRAVLTLTCFGVVMSAAWATWLGRPSEAAMSDAWLYGLCWLPAGYFTLLHMVFVGSIRYREPAVLVLVVLAGSALSQLPPIRRWFVQTETRKSSIDSNG